MYNELTILRDPPPNRLRACGGGKEQHMPEAAVILAFAMYLLDDPGCNAEVEVFPDGEHAKRFEIRRWLEANSFTRAQSSGRTEYGGTYVRGSQSLTVTPKPGQCDVVGNIGSKRIVAECKGGIINTSHPGQSSKLRRGLCEAVGLLLVRPLDERQVAVVPRTKVTEDLAHKLKARLVSNGIEIALMDEKGRFTFVK